MNNPELLEACRLAVIGFDNLAAWMRENPAYVGGIPYLPPPQGFELARSIQRVLEQSSPSPQETA